MSQAEVQQLLRQGMQLEAELQSATLQNVQLSASNARQLAQLREESSRIDALRAQAEEDSKRRWHTCRCTHACGHALTLAHMRMLI